MGKLERIAVCVCAFSACFGLVAGPREMAQANDSDAALDTIAIINHINYAVEVVRTYNNVVALEEEYERISADNLNLNCIRDEETLQLIRNMLNTLNGMRMNDRARKWYRHKQTRDLQGAKLEGMSKMANTIVSSLLGDGDGEKKGFWSRLWGTAKVSAIAGVESYSDYKKTEHALQGKLEDDEFELDTEKLNKLHDMNDMLLERQWTLITKYHLDDRLRVTGKDVRALVRCLKGSSRKNIFRQLKPMQRAFEVYPTYWYYRAAMAMAAEEYKDALESCEHFERINRGLFRIDLMAANVAMIRIASILELRSEGKALEPDEKKVIEGELEAICGQNYSSENAELSIFCASVYLSVLGDVDAASVVLESLMAKLAEDSKDDLRDYCDLFTRPAEKGEVPPNTVYLVQCRMLRLAIDQKREHKVHVDRLKEICGRETTCSLEKLYYFGELRVDDLWEIAKRDVEKINLMAQGDGVVAEIPVAWFLLGSLDVSVEMLSGANVVETLIGDEARRSHVMSASHLVRNSKDEAYVRVSMPVKKDVLAGCDGARLRLRHVSWPVDLVYAPEKPFRRGDVHLVPVRVERFMGKTVGKMVRPDPMAQSKKEFDGLRQAAEKGDAKAQFMLGECYMNGEGVDEDAAVAVKWIRKAAEQGYAKAQDVFGLICQNGYGVAEDKVDAAKWYRRAADQELADAQFHLGNCYSAGNGVEENEAEAVRWYRKAADHGMREAQFVLGAYYELGICVSADKAEAERWYRKAAEQGDDDARSRLMARRADNLHGQMIISAFRGSGIQDDNVFIGDNAHGLIQRLGLVNIINASCEAKMFVTDVLLFSWEPARTHGNSVIITAKSLFVIHVGKDNEVDVRKWDLEDIKEIDWERRTDGCIWINKEQFYFLMDHRKPFVDTMKKILNQIRELDSQKSN